MAKDLWFRDAAIIGTAIAEGFELVVSTEKGFRGYANLFDGEIKIVEPVGLVAAEPTAPKGPAATTDK